MGSSAWQLTGRYHADPNQSLRDVQHTYFAEHYNLGELIPDVLADSRQCVAAVQDDDEYGLLETYTRTLEAVERLASLPIPPDIDSQIQMLRDFVYATGEPLENILDFIGVATASGIKFVAPLTDDQLMHLFGTSRPTAETVGDFDSQEAYTMIGRGHAVCFSLFSDSEPKEPVGIIFAGYTVD